VKQNDRVLDRAGFLRLFDQHTRVCVPSTTVETLLTVAAGAISREPVATVVERTIVVADPPPLPLRYYSRPTLLDAIAVLHSKGLFLEQLGKSTQNTQQFQ
jgi:hypothetical protein